MSIEEFKEHIDISCSRLYEWNVNNKEAFEELREIVGEAYNGITKEEMVVVRERLIEVINEFYEIGA